MNKVFSTLALATCLATGASAYTYNTPGTATGGALTGWDMQPTYSLEALYGLADKSVNPDMFGLRLGFSLYNDAIEDIRHQFGVYIAPMWGDVTYVSGPDSLKLDATLIPFTFGYDLNILLSDKFMLDLGVKAGYALGSADYSLYSPSLGVSGSDSIDANGFTYSVGAAIKMMASDSIQIKLGYEYSRSFLEGDYAGHSFSRIYAAHVISLGASVTF